MLLGAVVAISYGLLAIVGGIIGFAQVRSQMSLISGLVSGTLLILGGWLWQQGITTGIFLSFIVTMALVIVFVGRYRKTSKFMPAGLMIGLGGLALILMGLTLAGVV